MRGSRKLALLAVGLTVAGQAFIVGGAPANAASPLPGPVVRITPATPDDQKEPSIAINPTDPRNLVAGSIDGAAGGQCAVYDSTDRGANWTAAILPTASGFTNAGDPVIDFAADGTAYYLCMNTAAGNSELGQYVYVSTTGGQTWAAPVLAITRVAGDRYDKGDIVVDDRPFSPYLGNVYVAATLLNTGDVHFARSTTKAASFSNQQIISDAPVGFDVSLAVGADGAVYAAWSKETVGSPGVSNAILIDKSTDGGVSFGALSGGTDHQVQTGGIVAGGSGGVRPDPGRGNGAPYIATHPTDPNVVYAVWAEDPTGIDDSDIRFARSTDGGNTWPSSVRLNTDVNPASEFFSQYWPTMSVDPVDGEIDIIWYSDQNDPNRTDGTPLIDLYFTSSTDDGLTFATPTRVTPSSSGPFGFFGDYLGIDSYGGVAHPIWVDTTLGGGGQDVATAQIGAADLRITKDDDADPAIAGESIVYSISVTNDGPADAPDVVVTDVLPAGVSFAGSTVPCTESPSGTLTCLLGLLVAGASAGFDVTVDVDAGLVHDAGASVTLTNVATVDSTQGDPDQADNTAQETTDIHAETDIAIVSFAPVAPPTEVLLADPTTITLHKSITNDGPSGPVDVAVNVSATGDAGATVVPSASGSLEADLGQAEIRDVTETFTFTCLTSGPHTLTFDNTIQPADAATTDPDQSDNTASVNVAVDCLVPVAINIKPGSFKNPVNLEPGIIPVAVLTTAAGEYGLPIAFDATTIDVASVRFGPADLVAGGGGASEAHGRRHLGDELELNEITRDGDTDLLLHFSTEDSGVSAATTELCVRGTFLSGGVPYTFVGCDTVTITH
jgi:uncharacterized repeat protein (TIGR01451 family)